MAEINLYQNCFYFIRLFADFLSVFLLLMRLVLDNSFSFVLIVLLFQLPLLILYVPLF